jgi:hypothetical protein
MAVHAVVALLAALAVAPAPAPVCRITDDRLAELSGLVATRSGYVVVNDGSDDPAARRIFFLDRRCKVVRTVAYPSRPRDTEDLAQSADGTLWVGDIGDNSRTRSTIALWRLAPSARRPTLFRLAYPDGAQDAEALLLPRTGPPVVVTKSGTVYVVDGALRSGAGTTPLRRAGAVRLPMTGTSNPFSFPGRLLITGGAVSPDGQRAVLRTYADAFEFDVPDGDLVRAVTEGTPRVVALPDEPQGESIAYTVDGSALLTVSEIAAPPVPVLRYRLSTPPPAPSAAPLSAAPSPSALAAAAPAATPQRPAQLPVGLLVTGAILLAGAILLGVLVIRRRRG